MKTYELINCTMSDLDMLYNDSAWTWEGMSTDTENLKSIVEWFDEQGCPLKENKFFIVSGELMNEAYHLTGCNRYPNDLTLLSIMLDNITDVGKLILIKFQVGARWFDDIVDNNARRERFEER